MAFLRKEWLIVLLVLLLALFLRVYKVSSNPPGLTPDEAALGYNAYSILRTGKDEYGVSFPVIFKSFGDYKPGLYVYLTVPSVAIFGLNEFSTRLPSVIAGVITTYLVYLVVKELFVKNEKERDPSTSLRMTWLPFIAMAVAAINPWLIYFSRGAWEVNVALTLTLAGIYLFLKSFARPKLLLFVAAFLGLTLLDYQGAKASTGIVLFILGVLYWKQILKLPFKYLVSAFVVGLIISLPIIFGLFNGQNGRLTVFSIFSYPRPQAYLQSFLNEGGIKKGSIFYDLFYNEPLSFFREILGRFFNHFSGRFLFFEGDWANPRQTPPYQGVLVIGDAIFLVIGAIGFLRGKVSKEKLLVILWLLLATLPAILSRDEVHAVRSFNLSIPLIIFIAFGVNYILKNFSKLLIVIVFLIYTATYVYFLDAYFVHQPVHNSQLWEYGYKQMVGIITPIQNNYKVIKVQKSYDQPYIYFLFYQKYDPAKYQAKAKLTQNVNKGDVGMVEKLDNICFCSVDWPVKPTPGTLLVAGSTIIYPDDYKPTGSFRLISEIKYLNGLPAFRIIEPK